MPIMGSEWQSHAHLSAAPAHYPPQTLPSVRELIESTESAYHHSTLSVLPASGDSPISQTTPHAASPNESHAWTSINRASPHVRQVVVRPPEATLLTCRDSPTSTSIPATALDFTHRQPSPPQSAATAFRPVLTSDASRSLQDPSHSQTPIIGQRQDSAFQRIEPLKEAHPIASSPNLAFSHSPWSPNERQSTISPRPNSSPATPSSPRPVQPHSLQEPPPRAPLPSRNQSKLQPSVRHNSTDASRPSEHTSVHAFAHSGPKSMLPSAPFEQVSTTSTRQQRYNVRFAPNCSPENMPSVQKPRADPPVAPVTLEETAESPIAVQELPVTPSVEASIVQLIQNVTQPPEDHSRQLPRESSVERCQGCNEAWKRPLPNTKQWDTIAPAVDRTGIAKNSMDLIDRLRSHGKNAEAMYERWKLKHSRCVQHHDEDDQPLSPASEPHEDAKSTGSNGAPRDIRPTHSSSNKRKFDPSHDVVEQTNASKSRKVTFEQEPDASPDVHPSPPA